jgi:hypothetical protein
LSGESLASLRIPAVDRGAGGRRRIAQDFAVHSTRSHTTTMLCPLALLLLLTVAPPAPAEEPAYSTRVVGISDGDTLTVLGFR